MMQQGQDALLAYLKVLDNCTERNSVHGFADDFCPAPPSVVDWEIDEAPMERWMDVDYDEAPMERFMQDELAKKK